MASSKSGCFIRGSYDVDVPVILARRRRMHTSSVACWLVVLMALTISLNNVRGATTASVNGTNVTNATTTALPVTTPAPIFTTNVATGAGVAVVEAEEEPEYTEEELHNAFIKGRNLGRVMSTLALMWMIPIGGAFLSTTIVAASGFDATLGGAGMVVGDGILALVYQCQFVAVIGYVGPQNAPTMQALSRRMRWINFQVDVPLISDEETYVAQGGTLGKCSVHTDEFRVFAGTGVVIGAVTAMVFVARRLVTFVMWGKAKHKHMKLCEVAEVYSLPEPAFQFEDPVLVQFPRWLLLFAPTTIYGFMHVAIRAIRTWCEYWIILGTVVLLGVLGAIGFVIYYIRKRVVRQRCAYYEPAAAVDVDAMVQKFLSATGFTKRAKFRAKARAVVEIVNSFVYSGDWVPARELEAIFFQKIEPFVGEFRSTTETQLLYMYFAYDLFKKWVVSMCLIFGTSAAGGIVATAILFFDLFYLATHRPYKNRMNNVVEVCGAVFKFLTAALIILNILGLASHRQTDAAMTAVCVASITIMVVLQTGNLMRSFRATVFVAILTLAGLATVWQYRNASAKLKEMSKHWLPSTKQIVKFRNEKRKQRRSRRKKKIEKPKKKKKKKKGEGEEGDSGEDNESPGGSQSQTPGITPAGGLGTPMWAGDITPSGSGWTSNDLQQAMKGPSEDEKARREKEKIKAAKRARKEFKRSLRAQARMERDLASIAAGNNDDGDDGDGDGDDDDDSGAGVDPDSKRTAMIRKSSTANVFSSGLDVFSLLSGTLSVGGLVTNEETGVVAGSGQTKISMGEDGQIIADIVKKKTPTTGRHHRRYLGDNNDTPISDVVSEEDSGVEEGGNVTTSDITTKKRRPLTLTIDGIASLAPSEQRMLDRRHSTRQEDAEDNATWGVLEAMTEDEARKSSHVPMVSLADRVKSEREQAEKIAHDLYSEQDGLADDIKRLQSRVRAPLPVRSRLPIVQSRACVDATLQSGSALRPSQRDFAGQVADNIFDSHREIALDIADTASTRLPSQDIDIVISRARVAATLAHPSLQSSHRDEFDNCDMDEPSISSPHFTSMPTGGAPSAMEFPSDLALKFPLSRVQVVPSSDTDVVLGESDAFQMYCSKLSRPVPIMSPAILKKLEGGDQSIEGDAFEQYRRLASGRPEDAVDDPFGLPP